MFDTFLIPGRTTMETSLFTYGADESWETINDVNHQPVFYEELIANQSLSSRVEEVARECSGVKECMFDALVTNNMDLATFSRDFVIEDSRQRMVAGLSEVVFTVLVSTIFFPLCY